MSFSRTSSSKFSRSFRRGLVDLQAEFELELVEGGLDFVGLAAALVDGGDALLEIDAGLDGAEHLVAGAEHALEELEFFGEEFEDAFIGGVLAVEKIDDHDVVFLAVAVAAADALLDALGIPREVVVYDEGAELEIDTLRARLGGDHDGALFAEVIHEGGTHVGGFGAGDAVGADVTIHPAGVNGLGAVVGVGAVEKNDAGTPRTIGEHAEQIALRAARFGEDNGLLRGGRRHAGHAGETDRQGLEQGFALGIGCDGRGERGEGFEVGDFLRDGGAVGVGKRRGVRIVAPLLSGLGEGFVILIQLLLKGGGRLLWFDLGPQAGRNGFECSGDGEGGRGEELSQHQRHEGALAGGESDEVVAAEVVGNEAVEPILALLRRELLHQRQALGVGDVGGDLAAKGAVTEGFESLF